MSRTITYGTREVDINFVTRQVGPGWKALVEKLIDDLFAAGWEGHLLQVKEKFGGLRFYARTSSRHQTDLITSAELISQTVCEETGLPGKIRSDLPWIRCLCDDEYRKQLKRIKDDGY